MSVSVNVRRKNITLLLVEKSRFLSFTKYNRKEVGHHGKEREVNKVVYLPLERGEKCRCLPVDNNFTCSALQHNEKFVVPLYVTAVGAIYCMSR